MPTLIDLQNLENEVKIKFLYAKLLSEIDIGIRRVPELVTFTLVIWETSDGIW